MTVIYKGWMGNEGLGRKGKREREKEGERDSKMRDAKGREQAEGR